MKRLIVVLAIALAPAMVFADSPLRYVGEKTVTVNATTGGLYTIDYTGYVNIFAHAKCYFNLDPAGVTPNTSSKYLAAGGSTNTNIVYHNKAYVGLLSDSGTITVNITVTAPEGY